MKAKILLFWQLFDFLCFNQMIIISILFTYVFIYRMIQHQILPFLHASNGLFATKQGQQKFITNTILVIRLDLNHNYIPSIIKEISHISFDETQFLQLSNNGIMSIEAMICLKAPKLKELHLGFNHITNISPIAKCIFMNLEILGLAGNKIIRWDKLSQIYFPKLTKLLLDDGKASHPFEQINILMKTIPKSAEFVRRSNNKIAQSKLLKMLEQRKK